ncbi:MAG: hypothetical protein UHL70_07850 [Acutalibacteraceae bacterium]|nr:hypothetical protein [Acutalibacteraceae bacterium]
MQIDMNGITSPELLQKEVEKMNSFGVRLTGTKAQRNFIKYLKEQIHSMGIETFSDPSRFMRWEETNKKLVIKDLDEETEIPISSAFPYSGRTPAEGITAELTLVKEKHVGYLNTADKIAVVEVDELDFLPSEIAFNERERSIPEGLSLPSHYNGPVATAFVNFPFLKMAKLAGAKAVICIWKGINDDCIEGQYLPFILDYQGIPAVWVNSKNGQKVIEAAEKGSYATLTLEGIIDEYAKTESFWCVLDGEEEGESVIINTHTDGTNCIEENGPIAMLAMIRYLKDKPLKRSHIFVFATGHFRLPCFKNLDGGGVQATSKWLSAHRSHWDGKEGHLKAVAGLSVEHLGCKMWKTEDGEYKQVGDVETEIVYTGNKTMDDIYFKSLEDRTKVHTLTLRGHNLLHFGEGQPLFNCGIPEIALVTAPDCLCVISDNHEMDKFDADLMFEQTVSFIKMALIIDSLSSAEISQCDGYSAIATQKMVEDGATKIKEVASKVKDILNL